MNQINNNLNETQEVISENKLQNYNQVNEEDLVKTDERIRKILPYFVRRT